MYQDLVIVSVMIKLHYIISRYRTTCKYILHIEIHMAEYVHNESCPDLFNLSRGTTRYRQVYNAIGGMGRNLILKVIKSKYLIVKRTLIRGFPNNKQGY